MRDGWAQWHVKILGGELARIVYSKQWKSSSNFKAFFWTKKCFERIPSRPEFAFKFADWFSSVFQSLQMHCRIFCNLTESVLGSKQIRKSWYSQPKKIQIRSYSGPGISVTVPGSTLLRTPMAMVLLAQSKLLEFGDACHHCWSFSCDVSVSHFLTRCHRRLRERLKPSPWIWWMRRVDSQTWVHGHSICEEFSRLCETYPSGCWFDSNKKPT